MNVKIITAKTATNNWNWTKIPKEQDAGDLTKQSLVVQK